MFISDMTYTVKMTEHAGWFAESYLFFMFPVLTSMIYWVSPLVCLWDVTSSNLSLQISCIDRGICDFPQNHQANARIAPDIRLQPLTATSCPVHQYYMIWAIDSFLILAIKDKWIHLSHLLTFSFFFSLCVIYAIGTIGQCSCVRTFLSYTT